MSRLQFSLRMISRNGRPPDIVGGTAYLAVAAHFTVHTVLFAWGVEQFNLLDAVAQPVLAIASMLMAIQAFVWPIDRWGRPIP